MEHCDSQVDLVGVSHVQTSLNKIASSFGLTGPTGLDATATATTQQQLGNLGCESKPWHPEGSLQ